MSTLPPGFWHEYRLYVFILENVGIVVGYAFLALIVVPKVAISLRRTRIGGIGFFLTCAMTHGDQALHSALEPHEEYGTIAAEWHMLAIHGAQVIFVLMFVSGLYLEFVQWGPWALRRDRRHGDPAGAHRAVTSERRQWRRRAGDSLVEEILTTTQQQEQDRTETP